MKRIFIAACLSLLLFALAYGQQADGPLTNAAVVKLVKAGFKEKTVITIINNRPSEFKLDTEHLIELKHNGVTENIILAMLSSQMGTVFLNEDEWSSESFFKDSKKQNGGDSQASGGDSILDRVRARSRRVVRVAVWAAIRTIAILPVRQLCASSNHPRRVVKAPHLSSRRRRR